MIDTINKQGTELRGLARDPRLDSPLRLRNMHLSDEEFLSTWHRLTISKTTPKKQSPTNALTDAIIEYAKLNSCAAYRLNSTGIYDERINPKTGREIGYRQSGQKKGLPDVIIIMRGMFLGVEVKGTKGDVVSIHQTKRMDEIIKAGGAYFVAKNFDNFKTFLDDLI